MYYNIEYLYMPERTAILSDIHGNSPALKAVLDDVRRQGCTRMFVLGDIYNGIDPHGCVDLVRSWGKVTCIKGNAELYLFTPDLENVPRRDEPWNEELVRLMAWWRNRLSPSDLEWLGTLPEMLRWNGFCMVHDDPADRQIRQRWYQPGIEEKYQDWFYHSQGIWEGMSDQDWHSLLALMGDQDFSGLFCGHTHQPFLKVVAGKTICNAGSAGFTLDGIPQPSWVMVEENDGAGAPVVEIRRVRYEIDEVLKMIDDAPDYPGMERPEMKQAFKRMFQTGLHWKVHLRQPKM